MKLFLSVLFIFCFVTYGCNIVNSGPNPSSQAAALKKYQQSLDASLNDLAKIKLLSEAIQIVNSYWVAYHDRAKIYVKTGRLNEAERDYTKAIDYAPENHKPRYHFIRGRFYQEHKKDLESAEKDYTLACTLPDKDYDDKLPFYFAQRGIMYQDMKKKDLAIKDYNSALQRIGDSTDRDLIILKEDIQKRFSEIYTSFEQ